MDVENDDGLPYFSKKWLVDNILGENYKKAEETKENRDKKIDDILDGTK